MEGRLSFSPSATFLISLLLSILFCDVSAIVLQDLPHAPEQIGQNESNKVARRKSQFSALELRSEETFTWGGTSCVIPQWDSLCGDANFGPVFQSSQALLANLTVLMPEAQENILSLQRFKTYLRSVQCTEDNIDLKFKDDAAFAYAQNIWNWVNEAKNHTFVLVAGTGDCGWNQYRVPFMVSKLVFKQNAYTVHLKARASRWEDAFHTYSFRLRSLDRPLTTDNRQLVESNWNRSVDFEYKLPYVPKTWDLPIGGRNTSFKMDCDDCGTHGHFVIGLNTETVRSVTTKAEGFLKPFGVAIRMAPRLTMTTNLTTSLKLLEKDWPAATIGNITIPGGVLNIKPEMIYSIGAEAGPLISSSSISGGFVLSLNDSAAATYDLLTGKSSLYTEWAPKIALIPWTVGGSISGQLKMFTKVKLQVTTKTLGEQFDLGISLTPSASVKLDVVACKFSHRPKMCC
jgi:hypothetical protein